MEENVARAIDQYSRIQSFFSRADSRASVILGLDLAMFGLLIVNSPPLLMLTAWHIVACIPIGLLSISLYFILCTQQPQLKGGKGSLIYFGEIADMTETAFIDGFKDVSSDNYLKDILQQTHRNSVILKERFAHIRSAYHFLILSIPFWLIALVFFVFTNNNSEQLLRK